MSKKFVFKKSYSNFHPALHWNIIIFSGFFVFVVGVVYAGYLYFYTKSEIDTPIDQEAIASSTANASTTLPFESLKSVRNIEQVLDVYKKRSETYTEIMYGLKMGEVPLVDTGNVATDSIATSSK